MEMGQSEGAMEAEPENSTDIPTPKKNDLEDSEEVLLFAEGQVFKASKKKLIEQTHYYRVFYGLASPKWKKSELPQREHSAVDMQLFLDVLHEENCLTENNIQSALTIAQFFMSSGMMDTCERWLMEDTKMSKKEKFKMADEFHFEGLARVILREVSTIAKLRKVLPVDLKALNKNTQNLVLEKVLKTYEALRRTAGKPRWAMRVKVMGKKRTLSNLKNLRNLKKLSNLVELMSMVGEMEKALLRKKNVSKRIRNGMSP